MNSDCPSDNESQGDQCGGWTTSSAISIREIFQKISLPVERYLKGNELRVEQNIFTR
jgi:hypothetical protein